MTFQSDLALCRFEEWALHDLGFLYQKRQVFGSLIWLFQKVECMTWDLYMDKVMHLGRLANSHRG